MIVVYGQHLPVQRPISMLYAVSNDNKLTTVFKKEGNICIKKIQNGCRVYVACTPQPDSVVQIHRYYTTIKGDASYKKRVTTITQCPADMQNIKQLALVEYSGTRITAKKPHGNSKSNVQYTRTDPVILEDCASQAKFKPPSEVCFDAAVDNCFRPQKC